MGVFDVRTPAPGYGRAGFAGGSFVGDRSDLATIPSHNQPDRGGRDPIPANCMAESADRCKINDGRSHGRVLPAFNCVVRLRLTGNRVILIKRRAMNSDRTVSKSKSANYQSVPSIVPRCLAISEQNTFRLAEVMLISRVEQLLLRASRHRAAMLTMICFVVVVAMSGLPRGAKALMVGATPGVTADTSMNPATPGSGWTQGDPGWANAGHTSANLNAVYIGDGWMLSAFHTGVAPTTFAESGQTLNPIPGQDFQVSNADLRLFRINGDPTLLSPTIKSVTIASQPLAVNDQVMFISYGLFRDATELSWTVTPVSGDNNDIWTQVGSCSGSNCYHGYGSPNSANNYGKRWGVNTVEDDQTLFGTSENDANITVVVNGTTVTNLTQYAKQNAPCGSNCFEAQVISGDSGSAVYHKRNGVWELAGITVNIFAFDNQNTTTAVYRDVPFSSPPVFSTGDASAFVDLSSYYSQITSIISAHQDYSSVGDLNLDGTSGTAADISAFVAGWGYDNGTGAGTITSWKNGDLTHDGKTDVNDFLRFRSNISAGAGAELSALMSNYISGGVPEPSTAVLIVGPAVIFALRARRRSPRPAV